MADTSVKSSNTAVTEQDKIAAARRKDFEQNLKSAKDVDAADRTAVHAERLPSDVDAVAKRYNLTTAEAERVLDETGNQQAGKDVDAAVEAVVNDRTVHRPVYVEEPAGFSHPLADRPHIPVPPTPPTVEELDPYGPKGDDPTARVVHDPEALGIEPDTTALEDAADAYAEAADEAVEAVDEAVEGQNQ